MKITKAQATEKPTIREFERNLKRPDIEAALGAELRYGLTHTDIQWPAITAVLTHVVEKRRMDAGREIYNAFLRGREEMKAPLREAVGFLVINGYERESLDFVMAVDMPNPEILAAIMVPYDKALKAKDYRTANRLAEMINYGVYADLLGPQDQFTSCISASPRCP
jgi:hypothetical protein